MLELVRKLLRWNFAMSFHTSGCVSKEMLCSEWLLGGGQPCLLHSMEDTTSPATRCPDQRDLQESGVCSYVLMPHWQVICPAG